MMGCSKDSYRHSQNTGTTKKDTISLAMVSDPTSLHPHDLALNIRGLIVGKFVLEGLTRLNLKGEYELAHANNFELSPSQTTYTFHLRPTFFSDGTLVSAYDYERCWKEGIGPESRCTKAHFFYCIKNAENAKKGLCNLDEVGVRALDDQTLVVDLEYPAPYFLELVASPLFSPFKTGKEGRGGRYIYSGPYFVQKWKKNNCLKLQVNPQFADNKKIQIKNVDIYFINDSMTALSLYQNGEIDWIGGPFNWLSSDILSKGIEDGLFFREKSPVHLPFWMRINTSHHHLSSPFIRQALSMVINRREIAQHLTKGADPLFTPFPNTKLVDPTFLQDDNQEEGRKLFAKGLQELGLTKESFPPIKILVLGMTTIHKKLAEYLQEKWETILGIRVELDVRDAAGFYGGLASGNYQIGGHYITAEPRDPIAYLELLHESSNFSPWRSSEYEQTIQEIRHATDLHTRDELIKKAEKILYREVPVIWIVNDGQYHSYRNDLKQICFDHVGIPDFRWAYIEESSGEHL